MQISIIIIIFKCTLYIKCLLQGNNWCRVEEQIQMLLFLLTFFLYSLILEFKNQHKTFLHF